jgi:hypothetical protein
MYRIIEDPSVRFTIMPKGLLNRKAPWLPVSRPHPFGQLRESKGALRVELYRDITRYMNRASSFETLTEVQRTVQQLLDQLRASEHDKFAGHLISLAENYRLTEQGQQGN